MHKFMYALLFSLPLSAMENSLVRVNSVFVPNEISSAELYHSDNGFAVAHEGKLTPIAHHDVDASVRGLTPEQLAAFTKAGYLSLRRYSNGDFKLDGKVRGLGGGPLTAMWMYGFTKASLYGIAIGAAAAPVAAIVVASGGGAVPAAAATMALKTAALGAGGAAASAGVVGAGAATAATVAAGTAATTEVVAAAAASGGIVACIETASLAAFSFFLAQPWCP